MKTLFLSIILALSIVAIPALAQTMQECNSPMHCANTCSLALNHIAKSGDRYAKQATILKDCIAICKTNADFQKRQSSFAPQIDALCADICSKCAQSCEELNDPSLKSCIEMCKHCAAVCKTKS
jgi:hypothetical protein